IRAQRVEQGHGRVGVDLGRLAVDGEPDPLAHGSLLRVGRMVSSRLAARRTLMGSIRPIFVVFVLLLLVGAGVIGAAHAQSGVSVTKASASIRSAPGRFAS